MYKKETESFYSQSWIKSILWHGSVPGLLPTHRGDRGQIVAGVYVTGHEGIKGINNILEYTLCFTLVIFHKFSQYEMIKIFGQGKSVYIPVHCTVRSLAPICSSTPNTMFSELCFKQTHTARQRLIKRKGFHFGFLGTSWLL